MCSPIETPRDGCAPELVEGQLGEACFGHTMATADLDPGALSRDDTLPATLHTSQCGQKSNRSPRKDFRFLLPW
jgi:hypothetical protein